MKNLTIMRLVDKVDSLKTHVRFLIDTTGKPHQDHLWAIEKSLNDALNHAETLFRLNERSRPST